MVLFPYILLHCGPPHTHRQQRDPTQNTPNSSRKMQNLNNTAFGFSINLSLRERPHVCPPHCGRIQRRSRTRCYSL
jgi:hypothetical protein